MFAFLRNPTTHSNPFVFLWRKETITFPSEKCVLYSEVSRLGLDSSSVDHRTKGHYAIPRHFPHAHRPVQRRRFRAPARRRSSTRAHLVYRRRGAPNLASRR